MVEGCQVQDVSFLADNTGAVVKACHDDGSVETVRARFLLDASGRDTFLGNHFKAKKRNKKHNSAAIYGHFSGVERHEGKAAGNITLYWFDHGWFWLIPLIDGTTSIGVVVWPYYLKRRKNKSLELFLQETIAMCAPLSERLKNATLTSSVEATGNFSYQCDRSHGRNYLLLGDAYAFIDPVFSSGVLLAMKSAFVGADTVEQCLSNPKLAKAALKKFDKSMKVGPKEFSWFIYRITNPALRDLFMAPRNIFRVKEGVLSVLAGDVFGPTKITGPLRIFRFIYNVNSLLNIKRTYKAWKTRKSNIQQVTDSVIEKPEPTI